MLTMSHRQQPKWTKQPHQQIQPFADCMSFEPSPKDPVLTQSILDGTSWDNPGLQYEGYSMPFDQGQPLDTSPTTESTAAPSATVPCFRKPQPTAEDWETHRRTITRLYIDEDRPLKDVMQLMQAQHHFKATQKMYKSRLTAWNVRKYMTWAERETACRVMKLKQNTGEACGKVIVRGKERRPDVFLRHMGHSRAGMRRRQLLQGSNRQNDIVINGVEPQPLHLIVQPTMYPSGPERNCEVICKEMPYLICAVPETYVDNLLLQSTQAACDMSRSSHLADVRISLNRAAVWFHKAIAARPATALLSLLTCQVHTDIRKSYHPHLFSSFYRHLLDLTRECHGPQHSLTSLIMHLLQLDNDSAAKQLTHQNVLASVITIYQECKVTRKPDWQRQLAWSLGQAGQHQKAIALLVDAMDAFAEAENSYRNCEKMQCGLNLALLYIRHNSHMHEEAERILWGILEAGRDEITGEFDPFYVVNACFGLGRLAEKRCQAEAAVSFYRLFIQAAMKEWGENHLSTLGAVMDLVHYFRFLSREEEAAEAENWARLTDEFSGLDLE